MKSQYFSTVVRKWPKFRMKKKKISTDDKFRYKQIPRVEIGRLTD